MRGCNNLAPTALHAVYNNDTAAVDHDVGPGNALESMTRFLLCTHKARLPPPFTPNPQPPTISIPATHFLVCLEPSSSAHAWHVIMHSYADVEQWHQHWVFWSECKPEHWRTIHGRARLVHMSSSQAVLQCLVLWSSDWHGCRSDYAKMLCLHEQGINAASCQARLMVCGDDSMYLNLRQDRVPKCKGNGSQGQEHPHDTGDHISRCLIADCASVNLMSCRHTTAGSTS